ncbi:MAG TPA: hypothetical protein VE338_21415 [Ktedonobacterales bacterium]|jgi:thiosulfate dehydrogenase [quinone] large subunit|nr:hypothetical protein [Ktedonobacterales bacterium]
MIENRSGRLLLSSVQLIAAYEFLVSGLDKVISGRFPAGLAATLMDGMGDNPNQWYMHFIHTVIVPHAAGWGYLIEYGELAVGVALLLGAARWLAWPTEAPYPRPRLAATLTALTIVAALLGAVMTFNFHLWMGKSPIVLVSPANPFDEGVDLDLTLTLTLLAVALVNALALPAFARFVAAQQTRVSRLLWPRLPLGTTFADR